MPKISVIIPVYKVEGYIHKCINSVLTQTYTDFELILVDDGSPDKCGEICDDYAKKDSRIKVIHKLNGGLADARNAGLDIAKGDYISFIDSDDYIEKDMYEKLITACIQNNIDISMCGRYNVFFSRDKEPCFTFDGQKIWSSKEAIGNLLTWNNIDSSACDKLYKKEIFNDLRFPLGKHNEDIFIMVNILDNANQIIHIGESKYFYNHRHDSITTNPFTEKNLDMLEASEKVLHYVLERHPDLKLKAESFYYNNLIYLLMYLLITSNKKYHFESYKLLKRLLNSGSISILSNKFIGLRRKVYTVLLLTNTFPLFREIRKLIRS